ncbi:MAG: YegS/Rv2252/BmrU family lipid kinase [Ilumatobacteraceae bacterium]
MTKANRVAVVAHNQKTLGGGLARLREFLAEQGINDPQWFEVPKSRLAPDRIKQARKAGAELIFVWGGDGTVQRSIDAMVGHSATLAILPAGTANLLATNLKIPIDLEQAVMVGLTGVDKVLDVGRINGEHFAVMAGTGLDALMIRDADSGLKDRFGRAAYVWTAVRHVRHKLTPTTIEVDDNTWFDGDAGCVLIGNVGDIAGGITAFDHAAPDDGRLDLAVVTASGALQWARTLTRAAIGRTDRSPLVQMTTAKRIDVRMKKALPYELDGGARPKTKRLKIRVVPRAVTIRVPAG